MPITALAAALALATAPAPDGAKTFTLQCASCHGAKTNPMAPALAGVAGRPVASAPGFAYSAGLKAKGGVWSDDRLDAFLTSPMAFAPGTRMPTAVADPARRAAIVDYLKTLK
ncbi:cytochrome c family protein [Phenylobacterium aquaticum]|uniref:c-type cytochrome n=1 Tax=Phenylobacterium aquaticum TaxID=1763816 RepID=UPI0026EBCFEA|nr:c-type cytochrome [Phenylobacterium aquaticum]